MSEFFEIAYATVAKRLCLFTGTGFSKAVTGGAVPGWQELLEIVCRDCEVSENVTKSLFPSDGNNPLNLDEAAHIVGLQLSAMEKSIHEETARIVSSFELTGGAKNIRKFFSERSFRVITTNYDKLAEKMAGTDCQSLTPGLPIPRSNSRVKVFHVHGSVDFPSRMVVTSDDYFKFMNSDSYFSRKLSTVLHENTVVILGYSLGDTNLKAILSDYSGFMRDHTVSSSVFFVSRSPVDPALCDYYASCYGIRVIQNTEIETFFGLLQDNIAEAEKVYETSIDNIKKVLYHNHHFKDSFLKMGNSFTQVISSVGAVGESLESAVVVQLFEKIIDAKRALCQENGAWEQYTHLASWLAHLGTLIDIKGRSVEATYLSAVKFSMEHMSRRQALGYSWQAYRTWDGRWKGMRAANRALIAQYIKKQSTDLDALEIVSRG